MNMQKFFDTLFRLYGEANSVKVKYSLSKREK
jgi:hypothetical protein